MKVLILSANIGGFDSPKQHAEQDIECDWKIVEGIPREGYSNRAAGKSVKMNVEQKFPDYDVIIWVDANVTITNKGFARMMVEKLADNDIAISNHPYRKTTGQEYDYIISQIEIGNKYLSDRYDPEKLNAERIIVGDNLPLYWCGCFAYWNTVNFHYFGLEWFEHEMKYAMFDQCSFSYFAKIHDMKISSFSFNGFNKNDYLTVTNHLK